MRQRRDLFILISLFVALVVFTILGPSQASEEEVDERTTTYSSAPDGVLALLRWLERIGYDAQRLEFRDFAVDESVATLVILNPTVSINRTQSGMVLDWVEQGGTLILAQDTPQFFGGGNQILRDLELEISDYESAEDDGWLGIDGIERAPALQPALTAPPVESVLVRTSYAITTERDDIAPLVGVPDGLVLAGIAHGKGYIYVSSASYPFTNAGLRDEQNAALALNLLRRTPPGGRVLFDEYHHGFFEPPSLRTLIFGGPWGWALIYAMVVLALYLILTGRRFGAPIPLPAEIAQRSSAEYVESMADLLQRGGKRGFVLRHYYVAFKRRLARPFGINPQLEDAAFAAEIARYRTVDQPALHDLLKRLSRSNLDESELLRVVAAADNFDISGHDLPGAGSRSRH